MTEARASRWTTPGPGRHWPRLRLAIPWAALNPSPVITEIEGWTSTHHQRRRMEGAFPLVITGTAAGLNRGVHKVIEPLTDPTGARRTRRRRLPRVCPSLPGYGFSGKPTQTGWAWRRSAALGDALCGLGYDRYGAQVAIGARGHHQIAAIAATGGHSSEHAGRQAHQEARPTRRRTSNAPGRVGRHKSGVPLFKQQSTRRKTVGYGLGRFAWGQLAWILREVLGVVGLRRQPRKRVQPG